MQDVTTWRPVSAAAGLLILGVGCGATPAPTPPDGAGAATAPSAASSPAPPAPLAPPTAEPAASAGPPAKACTKMGCESALVIPIVWGKDTLTSSRYKIEVTADGKKGVCEVFFPYPSCAEPRKPTCTGDLPLRLETGCKAGGSTASDMTLGPLTLGATPAKASLKMWRDKVMWHQQELTFSYADVRPNGEGCEPLCRIGSRRVCVGQCAPADVAAAPPDTP